MVTDLSLNWRLFQHHENKLSRNQMHSCLPQASLPPAGVGAVWTSLGDTPAEGFFKKERPVSSSYRVTTFPPPMNWWWWDQRIPLWGALREAVTAPCGAICAPSQPGSSSKGWEAPLRAGWSGGSPLGPAPNLPSEIFGALRLPLKPENHSSDLQLLKSVPRTNSHILGSRAINKNLLNIQMALKCFASRLLGPNGHRVRWHGPWVARSWLPADSPPSF